MSESFELELGKAGHIVAFDMCKVRKGETVLLTVDSVMDFKPVMEAAKACEAAGGKVMVALHSTPNGYGKVADPQLPESLRKQSRRADVWIEFNNEWPLYLSAWIEAMSNGRTRYLFLGGLDPSGSCAASPSSTWAYRRSFRTRSWRSLTGRKRCGSRLLLEPMCPSRMCGKGQSPMSFAPTSLARISLWDKLGGPLARKASMGSSYTTAPSPARRSGSGGSVSPDRVVIKKGKISEIKGQEEAKTVKKWLEKLGDPNMYNLAHVCYGFNLVQG